MPAAEPTTATQQAVLDRLLFRLEDGFVKIADAAAKGQDTARWEDVWIRLLEDYERLYAEQERAR